MTALRKLDHAAATALMKLNLPLARWRIRLAGARCAATVRALGTPIVHCSPGSSLEIEDDVVLCSWSRWTALGVAHPVILRTLRSGARLRIGRGTGISGGSFCAAIELDIGERCLIGADVVISDTDFHALTPAGRRNDADWSQIASAAVRIGNDVFVGTRVTILKGLEIGDGAVIGAGAVVTRSVPAGAIVAGNHARVVGTI
jgi:acetyltransferase-like isoleucine patch superfamily enzyme